VYANYEDVESMIEALGVPVAGLFIGYLLSRRIERFLGPVADRRGYRVRTDP
jgi:hypothetical protein